MRYTLTIFLSLFFFANMLTPAVAHSASSLATAVRPELNIDIPTVSFTDPDSLTTAQDSNGNRVVVPYIGEYLSGIFKYGVSLLGLVAVLTILFAGLKLSTAAGNKKSIDDAKEMIHHALFGLTIALGSYSILWIIDPSLTEFKSINLSQVTATPVDLEMEAEASFIVADSKANEGSDVTVSDGAKKVTAPASGPAVSTGGVTFNLGKKQVVIPPLSSLPTKLQEGQAPPGFASIEAFNKDMLAVAGYIGSPEKNGQLFCNLKDANKSTKKTYGDSTYFGSVDCSGNYGQRKAPIQYIVLHTSESNAGPTATYWRKGALGSYKPAKDGGYALWKNPVSSHFYISNTGKTYQYADIKLNLAHCCSLNGVSVGVDIQPKKYEVNVNKKNYVFWYYPPQVYTEVKKIMQSVGAASGVSFGSENVVAHCWQVPGNRWDPGGFSWGAIGMDHNSPKHKCTWTNTQIEAAKKVKEKLFQTTGSNAQFDSMCPHCPI